MYKLYTFFDGCNVLVLPLQHFIFVLNQIVLTTMKRYIYTTNILYQLPHFGDTIYRLLGILRKALDT